MRSQDISDELRLAARVHASYGLREDVRDISEFRKSLYVKSKRSTLLGYFREELDFLTVSLDADIIFEVSDSHEINDYTNVKLECSDIFSIARDLYGSNSFDQVIAFIQNQKSFGLESLPFPELFIYCLSLYKLGEKDILVRSAESSTASNTAKNTNLDHIALLLQKVTGTNDKFQDPFLCMMYGVILVSLSRPLDAQQFLLVAVKKLPWSFFAWEQLVNSINTRDSFMAIKQSLPNHVMSVYFSGLVCSKLFYYQEAIENFLKVQRIFPESNIVKSEIALCYYYLHKFKAATSIFESILATETTFYRHMDAYSNILFITNKKIELSKLAHRFMKIHKFKSETCCIVGNYYCSKGNRERAIVYFERSLKLNPKNHSAWILIGHENVELEKYHAAIHCYQQASEIAPNDFRCWYSIGQVYEVLKMYASAIKYYEVAIEKRNSGSKSFISLAHCYENVGELEAAISTYRKAIDFGDTEGVAIKRLAYIFKMLSEKLDSQEKENQFPKRYTILVNDLPQQTTEGYAPKSLRERFEMWAAFYYENVVNFFQSKDIYEANDNIQALLYLARYKASIGKLEEARVLCENIRKYSSTIERIEAESLLTEILSRNSNN